MSESKKRSAIQLNPDFNLSGEENWKLCLQQLRAAGASEKLCEQFSFAYGYESARSNSPTLGINRAAQECGLELRWKL